MGLGVCITGFPQTFPLKIHKLSKNFPHYFFFQNSKTSWTIITPLLPTHLSSTKRDTWMYSLHSLHSSNDQKYCHFMIILYISQSMKLPSYYSKSNNNWILNLNKKVEITNFQRPQLNYSFFTAFKGLENGRSFLPNFQRPLKTVRILHKEQSHKACTSSNEKRLCNLQFYVNYVTCNFTWSLQNFMKV